MLALVAGPELRRVLERFERRSQNRGRVGVKLLAGIAAATALATPVSYVQSLQRDDGGFGDPQITAWATLGLVAAGADTGRATEYLAMQKPETATRRRARGDGASRGRGPPGRPPAAPAQPHAGEARERDDLDDPRASAGRPAGRRPVSYKALLSAQRPSGGWPWLAGGAADSNDTAAAMQALRAAGARREPIQRGIVFLRRHQNPDGGFELTQGRGSDTQSTAWAIQALLAAGASPGPPAFRYLQRMRRPNGSYRYNARYVTTPLWVTSQVLPALARKPFPLATG